MSFKCPFCTDERRMVKGIKIKNVEDHLIVTRDGRNNFHVHGPIRNKPLMKQFLEKIAKESGFDVEDN